MKKLSSTLCALGFLITMSSFTPPDDSIATNVKTAFAKTFETASEVTWRKEGDFYMTNFKIDNQDCSAAYNEKGELMSATRTIALSQLPLNINLALQGKYADYTVDKSVTELTIRGESFYYINAANAKQSVRIKANSLGDLNIESKTKS